jgi:hypothetical protein
MATSLLHFADIPGYVDPKYPKVFTGCTMLLDNGVLEEPTFNSYASIMRS